MVLEGTNNYRDLQNVYDECKRYLDYHTTLTMKDGQIFDGIIEGVETDMIIVLVGEDIIEEDCEEQANRQPFGFGRPRRFRRFRRRNFPLRDLAILSLLQYPYNNSPYSYYDEDYYDSY